MKKLCATLVCCALGLGLLTAAAGAGEALDITYRLENITADDRTVSGVLVIYALNSSGAVMRDAAISVPGRNNVTFDNRWIPLGTLADGQPVQVLSEFTVPAEIAELDAVEETVQWRIEYTDAAGRRAETEAPGRLVR